MAAEIGVEYSCTNSNRLFSKFNAICGFIGGTGEEPVSGVPEG